MYTTIHIKYSGEVTCEVKAAHYYYYYPDTPGCKWDSGQIVLRSGNNF